MAEERMQGTTGAGTAEVAGPGAPPRMGRLGMILFLAALGVLFASTLTAYLVVRSQAAAWPPAGSPKLPGGLWISTILLLVSSGTMKWASDSARAGREEALRNALLVTLCLGLAFLFNQQYNWQHFLYNHHLPPQKNLYAFTFYLLTGLHSLHVIGGLIGLGVTTGHAFQGRYTPAEHQGVEFMSMYWHFLDAVWIVMFVVLLAAA